MKDLNHSYEDRLFDLLDEKLTPEEAQKLMTAIAQSPTLKAKYQAAKAVHNMLSSTTLTDPSLRFTKDVMSKLNESPSLSTPPIWRGLFLLLGVFLVMGIAIVLVSQGVFNDSTTVDLKQIDLPKQIPNSTLPSFIIDGNTLMNVIIAMNMVIGFIVLDRTILKPLFSKRRTMV